VTRHPREVPAQYRAVAMREPFAESPPGSVLNSGAVEETGVSPRESSFFSCCLPPR